MRNSSWMFSAAAVRTVLALVKSVVVARGLGVDTFGRFALLVAFVGIVQETLNPNLGTAMIKYGADFRAQGRLDKLVALLKASVGLYMVLGIASVCIVTGVMLATDGKVVGTKELHGLVVAYTAVAATSYFDSLSLSLLRLFDRFRLNAMLQVVASTLDFVLVAGVVIMFPKQLAPFVLATSIGKLLDSSIVNVAALLELRTYLRPHIHSKIGLLKADLKPIGDFVLSTSGSKTLYSVLDRGDVLLLGALTTAQQVGIYAITKKLAQVMLRFTDPLATSIFPQLATLVATRRMRELRVLLAGVTKVAAVPVLALLTVGFFLREPIIVGVYGSGYELAGDPFYIHLVASAFTAMFFWHVGLMQSTGAVRARLIITLMSLPVATGLAFILAPAGGATGMALATTTARLSALGLMLFVCQRVLADGRGQGAFVIGSEGVR